MEYIEFKVKKKFGLNTTFKTIKRYPTEVIVSSSSYENQSLNELIYEKTFRETSHYGEKSFLMDDNNRVLIVPKENEDSDILIINVAG